MQAAQTLKQASSNAAQKLESLRMIRNSLKVPAIDRVWQQCSPALLEAVILSLNVPHDMVRMEVYDILVGFLQHSTIPTMLYLQEDSQQFKN